MNRRRRRDWQAVTRSRLRHWIALDHEDGAWIATFGFWQYEAWAVWAEGPDSGFMRSFGTTLGLGRFRLAIGERQGR